MCETVLLIEDEDDLRRLLRQMLQSMSLKVFEAVDGLAGLALYNDWRPDLVITDIMMPRSDGIETIREIMAINSQARIIAMSAGICSNYLDPLGLAQEAGATETLKKPFTKDSLLASLSRVCSDMTVDSPN